MVTARNQANTPIAPCMFWRRIHQEVFMNVTEYLLAEYGNAEMLYKRLSVIKTLGSAEKKAVLKLIDDQLEVIDHLDEETGTPLEERRLSFVMKVLAAARRLCLE